MTANKASEGVGRGAPSPRAALVRRTLAALPVLIGAVVLIGWALDVLVLKSVMPGLTTMKANTALGLASVGTGLLLLPGDTGRALTPGRAGLAAACGAAALLLGLLTLAEYAAGVSLGLDELLFPDPNTTSLPYPGRMAPATAGTLACAGAGVLLLVRAARRPDPAGCRCALAAHLLAAVPAGVGYLSLTGYAYNVGGLYGFGPFVSVAVNTAAGFALLAPATLLTLPGLGWRRAFAGRPVALGVLARLLPLSLLLPFATGAAVVWGARTRAYDPLFGPALFALAAVASSLGLAWLAAGAVRRAEEGLIEATAALRASEDRYRLTVESARDYAIVTLDRNGVITGWNIGAERMMGYAEAEAVGRPVTIFFTPEDVAASADKGEMSRAAAEGRAENERWHRRRDGSRFWGSGLVMPLASSLDGGFVKVFQDRTAAHEAEAALRRLNESLEARVREAVSAREAALGQLAHAQRLEALGQLAGGIAHDFNNVMQAVQGGAGLIRRRAADPQTVNHLARMVEDAAERGASVTRRLLAFARKGELRAEALDPAALFTGVQEVLEHTLGTGVQVRIEGAVGLPPLLADKGQLETVLVNLAANARDAMSRGGTLTLSAMEEVAEAGAEGRPVHEAGLVPGRYVRLVVSDTGEGMVAEVLARASEPFFTTKGVGKGTGLGLAMARGFAEQSGGGFAIRSTPGAGTTVTLWLPVAEGAEPARGASMGGSEAPQPADRVRVRVRVLVVDDEDLVREVLAEGLEEHGYAAQRAGDAAAALAMLDAGAGVDVLLTDYAMPGTDGLTLIREARRRRPGLAAVLLTGNAGGEVEARLALDGMAGGAFSLLRKPVRADELAVCLAAVLERVEQVQPPASGTK